MIELHAIELILFYMKRLGCIAFWYIEAVNVEIGVLCSFNVNNLTLIMI